MIASSGLFLLYHLDSGTRRRLLQQKQTKEKELNCTPQKHWHQKYVNYRQQQGMSTTSFLSVGLWWRIILAFSIVSLCSSLQQCQDSFAKCFLQILQFDIPDATVVIGLDTLRLRELKCNQCQIGGLQSSVIFPSGLNGELTEIKLHCDGTYSYGLIHGRLNAAISISSLTLDATISKSADGQYPVSVTSSSCNVHNLDAKVKFTGGAAGKVLNVITPVVESIIKKNVESTVCSKLSALTTVDGTNALVNQIDPMLKKLIDSGLPDPVDPAGDKSLSTYVHWPTSIVASANSLIFDDYSGRLGSCFFGKKSDSNATAKVSSNGNFPVPMDKIIDQYTSGTGTVSVDLGASSIFPIPSSISANSSIKFQKVTVSGLGDLTIFDAAHPTLTSNFSLSSSIYVKNIDVEVDFTFCSDTFGEVVCDKSSSSLMTKVTNVTVVVSCSVGALQKKLRSMHVEDLFDKLFWNSAIDYVNITSLNVQSNVQSITVSNFGGDRKSSANGELNEDLDTGIMNLMNNALILCLSDYQELIQSVISASLQGPLRHAMNVEINAILQRNKPPPDAFYGIEGLSEDDIDVRNLKRKGDDLVINWAEFEPLLLYRNISSHITSEDINSYIECLMYTSNQTISLVNSDKAAEPGSENSLQITSDLSLSGLDSIYQFSAFEPYSIKMVDKAHDLLTGAGIGFCQGDDRKTLDLRYNAQSSPKINSAFNSATLSLGNLFVGFEIALELLMGTYRSVQLDTLAKPGCAISIFQKMGLESLSFGITEAFLDVEYGNGSMRALGQNQQVLDLTVAVQKLLKMVKSPGSILQINNILGQYSEYSKALCADEASVSVKDKYQAERDDSNISFIVIMVCMIFGVISVLLASFLFKQRSTALSGSNDYQLATSTDLDLRVKESTQSNEKKVKNNSTVALCYNDQLSLTVRISLPLFIIANIALFVYSNICMDAVAVLVTLSSGTFSSIPEPVLKFGLLGTIVSMWEAKVYLLSILVAFLSGLWPYIKLFSLLACYVTPPPGLPLTPSDQQSEPSCCQNSCCQNSMTVKRRNNILRAVECLGKWGLLDFYVMVLMMCAFHFNMQMQMSNDPSSSSSPLLIEVLVKPNFGFFSFLLATMLSHAISHIMLACHRHAVFMDTTRSCETTSTGNNDLASVSTAGSRMAGYTDSPTSLSEESYRVIDVEYLVFCGHFPQSDECISMRTYSDGIDETPAPFKSAANYTKIKISDFGKTFLFFNLIQLVGLIIGVTLLFSFSFQFEGLVGYMLENQGKGKNIVDYSFFTVGMHMQEAAGVGKGNPWRGGLRPQIIVMQICYYTFGLVAPLLLLLALIRIWYLPLSRSKLEKNLITVDILGAWTALDVFCLSVAAALLEIRQFAAFIVGDHCQDIDSFTKYLMPVQAGKPMLCFDVITTLKLVSLEFLKDFY